MKIALLTHSVNPRGGVVHVLELGEALSGLGHEVTVVAPVSANQDLFRKTSCRTLLLPISPFVEPCRGLASVVKGRIEAMREGLRRHLGSETFDVLHAHDGIGANALADLQEQGLIDGYVRTVHHVDRYGDDLVQKWEERSIRQATRVLCVSSVWKDKIRESYGLDAHQVANGVRLSRFTPVPLPSDALWRVTFGVQEEGPRILLVGGVEARKNTVRLLEAFLLARQKYPTAQLVVAGGASLLDHSPQMQLFRATAALAQVPIGRGQPIVITGPVPEEAMPALYRSSEVTAMPSLLEGFGLAALEGIACGAQAVVSSRAPFTEHFRADEVHWADPENTTSISTALEAAIQTGRAFKPERPWETPRVCKQFSWDSSAQSHLKEYQRMLTDFTTRPSLREDFLCPQ